MNNKKTNGLYQNLNIKRFDNSQVDTTVLYEPSLGL